jgi:hypothetical protein
VVSSGGDDRRRIVLSQCGIRLVELDYRMFDHDGRKRLRRDREADEAAIRLAWRQLGSPERLNLRSAVNDALTN